MANKKIIFASDHGGYVLKELLKSELEKNLNHEYGNVSYEVEDFGTDSADNPVDYPDYGIKVAKAIADGKADAGVIICGSGIGISIAANRISKARAALCHDGLTARLARKHNNANILALGARIIGNETAKDCLQQFLTTDFEGGRHKKRVDKLCY